MVTNSHNTMDIFMYQLLLAGVENEWLYCFHRRTIGKLSMDNFVLKTSSLFDDS